MTNAIVSAALSCWGLERFPVTLIATRENRVYRVDAPAGSFALRLHRPGYRTRAELHSELEWMAALERGGMQVPRPLPSQDGELCVSIEDLNVDVLTFIHGEPVVRDGHLAPHISLGAVARGLGESLAKLHSLSDEWRLPDGFARPNWDTQGLLGEKPLWGRFWENPNLAADERALLSRVREIAAQELSFLAPTLDYGLIHADAVPENLLIGDNTIHLIDFDDCGFGYRLFDLATSLNRLDRHDPNGEARQEFLAGYTRVRPIDLSALPLFQLLRSLTYVGWIIDRIGEPGSPERSARLVREALRHASVFLAEKEEHSLPACLQQ